nr:unnamed protein product [Meloidogyne enterolobii]
MLVYTKREGLTVESKNFRIISVPINEEILKNFEGNMYKYKESDTYFSIGIYKEIITNENGILDWLQRDEYNNIKEYDIGIAEFDVMAGSFAVFAALGIKETFNVSSSIFPSQFLQFLEINVSHFEVPQYKFANPGDWENGIWQKDREENEEEHTRANREIKSIFENSKYSYNRLFHDNRRKSIEKPSTLEDLFNKIKYHFINQHPLIKFNNFPEHNKIVYIGGIVVEDHQLLIGGKQMVENEPVCVVLVSFGTVNYESLPISRMIERVFLHFTQCYFYVRSDKTSQFSNVFTTEDPLPQKQILSKTNTKVFISHCGINSVNESMYAGVPLICIPVDGDQMNNASTVEQKE